MAQGAKKPSGKGRPEPYKVEIAGRIYMAFDAFNRKRGRGNELSQDDIGALVARKLGQEEPISQATVSRWMSVTNPNTPDPPTLRAIATVLHADATWLYFGARED